MDSENGVPAARGGARRLLHATWLVPASFTQQLWRALALFAVLLIGAGLLVFNGIRQQNNQIHLIASRLQPLEQNNLEARAGLAEAQAILTAYLLSGNRALLPYYRTARVKVEAPLRHMARSTTGTGHRDVLLQVHAEREFFTLVAPALRLSRGSPVIPALISQATPSAFTFYGANGRLHDRLAAQIRHATTAGQHSLVVAVSWSGGLAGLALLLGLAMMTEAVRGVTQPLTRLTATLRLLAAGDHAARAAVAGVAESRQAARSLNALADESDRLRARQEEENRAREMARELGTRVRESLSAEAVIQEARLGLERNLNAELVYLHVARDGELGPPEGHEQDWLMPRTFLAQLPAEAWQMLGATLRARTSAVVQDITGPEGERLPAPAREPLRAAGVVSFLLVPFGIGEELLGMIAAGRVRRGAPWTAAEQYAVELIAADIARALHHARMYERENKLVGELRALDKEKSVFLATVSHELRTPLTSIAGYIEMMSDTAAGPLTTDQAHMLEAVTRNTERLRRLIEDVLTLSKIESGGYRAAAGPVDLTEITASVAAAFGPDAAARGLDLACSVPASPLMIRGDAGQVDRALMNVMSNAMKFTPRGGRVRLQAAEEGAEVRVTVSDTGMGIPVPDQQRLFTRFFRASNAVERMVPGSGLGLAIIRTIMDNHHGTIRIESAANAGTTVTLSFPTIAATSAREAQEARAARETAAGAVFPAPVQ